MSVCLLRDDSVQAALQKLHGLLQSLLCSYGYAERETEALLLPMLVRRNSCRDAPGVKRLLYDGSTRVQDILNDGDFIQFQPRSGGREGGGCVGITLLRPPPEHVCRDESFFFDVKLHDFERHSSDAAADLWESLQMGCSRPMRLEEDDYDYRQSGQAAAADPFFYLPTHMCSEGDLALLPPASRHRMMLRKGFCVEEEEGEALEPEPPDLATQLDQESSCLEETASLECRLFYKVDCSELALDSYSVGMTWMHRNIARVEVSIHRAGFPHRSEVYIVVSHSGCSMQTAVIHHHRPSQ